MRPTQEPPCCFQTIGFQFSRFARFSQPVKVGSIWLTVVEREGSASNSLHLALAMAMAPFRFFSGLFTDPFLSGIIGVFLHVRCIPRQNLQWLFWASVCAFLLNCFFLWIAKTIFFRLITWIFQWAKTQNRWSNFWVPDIHSYVKSQEGTLR